MIWKESGIYDLMYPVKMHGKFLSSESQSLGAVAGSFIIGLLAFVHLSIVLTLLAMLFAFHYFSL